MKLSFYIFYPLIIWLNDLITILLPIESTFENIANHDPFSKSLSISSRLKKISNKYLFMETSSQSYIINRYLCPLRYFKVGQPRTSLNSFNIAVCQPMLLGHNTIENNWLTALSFLGNRFQQLFLLRFRTILKTFRGRNDSTISYTS